MLVAARLLNSLSTPPRPVFCEHHKLAPDFAIPGWIQNLKHRAPGHRLRNWFHRLVKASLFMKGSRRRGEAPFAPALFTDGVMVTNILNAGKLVKI